MEGSPRRWLPTIVALLALSLVAVAAMGLRPAHLYLEAEQPTADSTIFASPPAVVLWFSQEPLPNETQIRLRNAEGSDQALGEVRGDPNDPFVFQAEVRGTLPPGKYTVRWRTLSDDEPGGLVRDGVFAFIVAAP
jgi:methionine-rich copper-binding protein CopC